MKIRRYILICLFFLMGSIGAGAQTMPLGTKMSAYRDFCLMVNKAFRECDTELLSKSIMDCGADGFYFNGEDLLVMPIDRFQVVEGEDGSSDSAHIYYLPEYVDSILIQDLVADPSKYRYLDQVYMERADFVDCKYAYVSLPAHGKGVYEVQSVGDTELMVVASPQGRVRLSIDDSANGFSYLDPEAEGRECAWASWKMNEAAPVRIALENTTDAPVSIMIVTN